MSGADKVRVAVRVRPFNRREIELGTKCVVDMDGNQTVLYHPSALHMKDGEPHGGSKKAPKTFAFDHSFWSMEDSSPKFAGQKQVFGCLGEDVLQKAFEGYNACIFAYGQTGSGKSYTMMGTGEQKGLIPRLCDGLFDRISKNTDSSLSFKAEVSYMEIYNEKVRDLLDPKGKHNLKVREHNILGPYVDGLSTLCVSSFEDIDNLMSEGNKSRTVAATNMNSESSRSHAVFNIIMTQTLTDTQSGVSGEKVSKMSLVDLAGSERAQKTGAVGDRLKEGSNINKSLTTLGLVISALADQASGRNKGKFVPYRDSVLTWLLKDNLGGNSKTVMVATLSPSADNYEETLSTLRYADRAKRIVNHAVVNEDPNARIIRELREEVETLRFQLKEAESMKAPDLQDRLQESEKLMKEMSKTWEEKLKETETIHHERHLALERMGISVQTSGIKVEQGKYYLVNLNADPSLNELLVYYLKDHTLVGRSDAPNPTDIQLSGLGIMPEHCVVDIENQDVFISPLEGARFTSGYHPYKVSLRDSVFHKYILSRKHIIQNHTLTCVNGKTINSKTKVKHGDRILWGNNHFFRINCPKATNSPSEPETPVDYDFAQQELMMQQMGDNPIHEAITEMEKQHEEEKQEALEKQRQMYERQMQMLRSQLISPSTPSTPYSPFDLARLMPTSISNTNIQPKYQLWAQEREKVFKQSLAKLKEELVKANTLVREANFLAQEMGKSTEFSVTLQIPASNLSPNRKKGAFVSEPAILVKRRGEGNQVQSMEKFENRIIDMRDMYEERKEKGLPMMDGDTPPAKGDPFYESEENNSLIGVANVFLQALFYDVKLDYQVPIISQQGEVAGRLHIELRRLGGSLPQQYRDTDGEGVGEGGFDGLDDESGLAIGSTLKCRFCIKEARGLPPALSEFVFCQYTFWGCPDPIVVVPQMDDDVVSMQKRRNDGMSFRFDDCRDFTVHVTEEFMEHCADGALSIEVCGHSILGLGHGFPGALELYSVQAKSRSLVDRWNELIRRLEMWVEIHELNEQGEYTPVEVVPKPEVLTGGVFQLRQGHSRRITVYVRPVQNSGTLPLSSESISLVQIGCVCARSKLQKGLDSYQEEDLNKLRQRWSDALDKRREYLDEQIKKIMNKEEKSEADVERERSLIDQWVCLTEERNAVLVPAPNSGIPGATADWEPVSGMEEHIPVMYLDLNAEDMDTSSAKEGLQAPGFNSILPKEHGAKFYTLPFVKNSEKDVHVTAVVSWDSSIHDSVHLNRVTPANERVYLILKVVVRLSHPASMELVLRKRICINIYKRQSITEKLKKRIGKTDTLTACGITYEVVSNIPKASEELEDRETLAQMAASNNETHAGDGESYIEKYIKGVSAVESLLTLDRLRQDVAIKELMAVTGKPLRKATSVPNIVNTISSPRGMDDKRSDSIQDLSGGGDRGATLPRQTTVDSAFRHRSSIDGLKEYSRDSAILPNKPTGPFSLTRPNFLNLRTIAYGSSLTTKPPTKPGISPQPTKLVKPMRTLVEEQQMKERKPLLRRDTEDSEDDEFAKLKEDTKLPRQSASVESDDFQDFESYQADQADAKFPPTEGASSAVNGDISTGMPHSSTNDSLVDVATKGCVASSITSSGYGSQAVSIQTLSSEDSSSVRSMSIDETPEQDVKKDSAVKSNDKMEENGDSKSNEKAVLPPVSNLIDTDCPSNLGSPIKPENTILEDSQDPENPKTIDEESKVALNSDSNGSTVSKAKVQTPSKICQNTDILASRGKPKKPRSRIKKIKEPVVDVYSETAMEELERLGEGSEEDASTSSFDEAAEGSDSDRELRPVKSTTNLLETSSVPSQPSSLPHRNSASQQDVSLVQSPDSDSGRSGDEILNKDRDHGLVKSSSLKKLRNDSRNSRVGPSPLKATYRPASMYEISGALGSTDSIDRQEEAHQSDNEDTMSICSFGSRADLHHFGESPVPSWVQIGEPVTVLSSHGGQKSGTVMFIGTTEFASGNWVGVALDTAEGKNDGSVKGTRYFKCKPRHGIFVRHDKLIMDKKRRKSGSLRRSTGSLASPSPQKENSSGSSFMRPTAASSAKHHK